MKLHRILFYIFLFLLPVQTRILYSPDKAYVSWYFDYHLAIFLYLSDILFFTCLLAWFLFDRPILKGPLDKLFLPIIGFLILCSISLFHVKQLSLGVYQTAKWFEFFALLLYIRLTFKAVRDFETGLAIVFVSGIFQSVLGWLQFHMQHMVGLRFLGEYIPSLGTSGLATIETTAGKIIRAYGTMPHPNILGGFLVLSLVSGLFFVSSASAEASVSAQATADGSADRYGTKWVRVLSTIGIVLIIFGIFVTFSRVAWLAAALAIIAFVGYYLWNGKKSSVLTLVAITLISATTILVLYKDNFRARLTDANQVSIEDRYFFNSLGWNLIQKFPALGVGAGNYVPALQDQYQLQPWQHQPAHNILIFIAAELGVLGAALFIAILFKVFKLIKKIKPDFLSFSLVLIGILFLLMGQFDHYFVTIQQGRLMFASVLGLIVALPNLYDNQRPS